MFIPWKSLQHVFLTITGEHKIPAKVISYANGWACLQTWQAQPWEHNDRYKWGTGGEKRGCSWVKQDSEDGVVSSHYSVGSLSVSQHASYHQTTVFIACMVAPLELSISLYALSLSFSLSLTVCVCLLHTLIYTLPVAKPSHCVC